MKKYPDHELAALFPLMAPDDRERLKISLENEPQLEPIVLYEGKVLEGRHRQDILIDDLNRTPIYIQFEELDPAVVAAGAFRFVVGKNLPRRHLTKGQLSMIAAELIPLYEKDAELRQKGALRKGNKAPVSGQVRPNGDSQETGYDDADEDQTRKGRSAKKAADAVGVGTTSVKKARKLLKTDPKKARKVKAGTLSLDKATRDADKEAARERRLADAMKRIREVCGRAFGEDVRDGTILKNKAELIAFAEQTDSDMAKTRGLIQSGFSLARARKYRMTSLSRTNTISDLCLRALAQGGKLSLDIEYQSHKFGIYVSEYPQISPGAAS